MDAYEFTKRFGELLRADRERGRVEPLASYQRMFPEFGELIAREYGLFLLDGKGPALSDVLIHDRISSRTREHYTQLGEIARGGMGAIIRVRDEVLGRDLAMKVVLDDRGRISAGPTETRDPMAQRFLEEAKITAQLDHPGVVPVHDLGADRNGGLFFTMKLIEGGRTLAQVFRLAREGDAEFSRGRVLEIFTRVLETLAFAHEKGIIHRDLKPTNVMVGRFGEVYVMDWGLAKFAGSAEGERLAPSGAPVSGVASGLTEVGQVLGTPAYMPLEQARGEPLDPRADIYAVGAMLYEFIGGSHPYGESGRTLAGLEILMQLLAGEPKPLLELAPGAPPELASIAEKAMARKREDRYGAAMEFAADLRRFAEGRAVRAHATGAWVELRKWIGRNRALSAALVAAVLVLVAGLVTAMTLGFKANRERDAARHQAYRADIGAAVADLANRDLHAARLRLGQTPEDLRGWEWRHLLSRLDESLMTTEGKGFSFIPSGELRVIGRDGIIREYDLSRDTVRVLPVACDTGDHAWITDDGEHVCTLTEKYQGARNRVLVRVKPLAGDGVGTRSVLDIVDRRWDRRFRMPVFPYTGADLRVHVLNLLTGREEYPQGLVEDDQLQLVGSSSRNRFLLLSRLSLDVVFDLETGRPVAELQRPRDAAAACLSVAPDGTKAAIGAQDGGVELWDLSAGRPAGFGRVKAHRGAVQFVEFGPGGALLASGGALDRSVKIIDVSTGTILRDFQGHTRGLEEGRFAPDGLRLLTRDAGDELRLFRADGGDVTVLRGHASYVYAVAFSPDGARIYSGGWDGFVDRGGAVRVWDAATGEAVAAFGSESLCVFALAVTRDGRRIVTVGSERGDLRGGALKIFDAGSGRLTKECPGTYRTLGLHPDGKRAVVAEFTPNEEDIRPAVVVLDLDTGAILATLLRSPVEWAAFNVDPVCSPDGSRIATPGANGKSVVLWDATSYSELRQIPVRRGVVSSIAFSPDSGRLLVAGEEDGWRVFDAVSGEEVVPLAGTAGGVLASTFTAGGRRILTGGRDRSLRIWDAGTFEEIVRLPGHDDYIKGIAASPNGEVFATASGDRTIRLWHTLTAEEVHRARIQRRLLVAELAPRVNALFAELGDYERVAGQLEREYRGPALETALQVALGESVAREAGDSPESEGGNR